MPAGTAWTRALGGATMRTWRHDLTDAELSASATACRAMAFQEFERAKRIEKPSLRGPIEVTAQRYAVLAAKIEAARNKC
jgi:hypothetical protein